MTSTERVWEHFKKILQFETWIWVQTLNLKETCDSNVLFIVFVNFQNINLCWDEANSRLRLNNNGVHSAFWIAYSSSRSFYRLCLRPWALVLGRHGYYNCRLLLYPNVPSWMYAWSLGCIYTTWNGSNSDLQLKMWLTKPNGKHFIISVLWVLSEGTGSKMDHCSKGESLVHMRW